MLQKAKRFSAWLAVLALFSVVGSAAADAPVNVWQPWISVVWPHDGRGNPTSVEESRMVNVSVWPRNRVRCDDDPLSRAGGTVHEFYLWIAKDNEPVQRFESPGQFTLREVNGVWFPTVEYNNVTADLSANPGSQYRFTLGLVPCGASNVWIHAADARTYKPEPLAPTGYARQVPTGDYDSHIQIVWPHDRRGQFAPVEQATLVNIAVDIFAHGTRLSVPPDFEPDSLDLNIVADDGPVLLGEPSGPKPEKVIYAANGLTFPRWVFNNVPVEPGKRYNFLALVYDNRMQSPYSTIWTHVADGRARPPTPRVPPPCLR